MKETYFTVKDKDILWFIQKSLFKNMISLKQRETNLFFTDIDKIKKKY